MSLNIDLYKERLEAYKISGKDGKVDSIKKSIIDNFYANPAYFEVLVNGEPRDVHMLPKKDLKGQNKLLCKPDESINIGDFVEWEDSMYICVNDENDNSIQYVGYITKCNNILTFQDPSTLQIYKIPCVLQDKTSVYSDGINEGKLIVLADDQIMVTVPNNEITKKIPTGKRFIFNSDIDNIYESTKVDRLLNNGLASIIMKRADHNPVEDNLELNIADYIQPPEQPEEPEIPDEPDNPTDYTITINGYDTVIFGTWEQYTISVLQDGVEVDKPVKFELIGDESLAWVDDIEGKICKVYANKDRVRGTVILRVSLIEDENVYAEKEITTVAW